MTEYRLHGERKGRQSRQFWRWVQSFRNTATFARTRLCIRIAARARALKIAPAANVKDAPNRPHNNPATVLAISSANPDTRLKKPYAVPRRSAGAVSATIVASKPCVMPICKPHSVMPPPTQLQWLLQASMTSAVINTATPHASKVARSVESDNLPNGYAEIAYIR